MQEDKTKIIIMGRRDGHELGGLKAVIKLKVEVNKNV